MDNFDDSFYQKYNDPLLKDRQCPTTGKRMYITKTACRNARKKFEKEFSKFYRIYLCPECNHYHLSKCSSKLQKNK